ncbi:glycoside hydrolase [uncultured Draconibacterium sp.]|uniref:glycoside hydrolase n=1 Tax=uncultured Draconibacterium sp. TaxID=1573823 RepID=UPI002AA759A6|nr:glycoside hydrolase [uncultured Draconibacterium sp.]
MNFFKLLLGLVLLCVNSLAFAQSNIQPVVNYTFNSGAAVDETGNSELFLYNNTSLFTDSERGSVLQFSASHKSYAAFNRNLLDTDTFTVSFFFFWENDNAGSWHQLFEIHNQETNSNLFFTPQIGWGNYGCALISDSKDYGLYETIETDVLQKNKWMHIAITFEDKLAKIYIDGAEISSGYLNISPTLIQGDSLYLGGNPHRSDNYYISARLDEIKVFDQALSANQILAVANETEIPDPEDKTINWETSGDPIDLTIDIASKQQTIQNFGSSDAWNTERIGKYWPETKKEKLAELLFSTEKDADGNPLGIGLSAWRFNIGAGTAEQGDASRISEESRRTEGFLNADGSTYNWEKQAGQQWFLQKANQYNVHHLIGWQNSPPVEYTQNNLGFREYGTEMATILKPEYFDDYARFLADVSEHFDNEGIHFDYISPLNEPQWGWAPSSSSGTVTQEGTPWTNQEIFDVVSTIDNEFSARNVTSKLFITEAASINSMTGGTGHADNQLYKFWNANSGLSLLDKSSFSDIVSYHSYFTDYGSQLVDNREEMAQMAQLLNPKPQLWQTEYSLLADGYRYGYPANVKLTEMQCALSLSRTIMADLNIANVSAWQWWTTFEQGKHNGESRFCLIEALTKNDNSDGVYHLTKLFYTFGNFSYFIRPDMTRVDYSRSDNLSTSETYEDIVFSAFTDAEESKVVIVATNFTNEVRDVKLSVDNANGKTLKNPSLFLTDEFSNLEKQDIDLSNGKLIVPAKSVVTFTADLEVGTSIGTELKEQDFKAYYNGRAQQIIAELPSNHSYKQIKLYNISGQLQLTIPVEKQQQRIVISSAEYNKGIFLVSGIAAGKRETVKVIIF